MTVKNPKDTIFKLKAPSIDYDIVLIEGNEGWLAFKKRRKGGGNRIKMATNILNFCMTLSLLKPTHNQISLAHIQKSQQEFVNSNKNGKDDEGNGYED